MTVSSKLERRSHVVGRIVTDMELEQEVLRMLWTFHWVSTAQLTRLVWGHNTGNYRTRLRPTLKRLLMADLIWQTSWRFLPGYRAQQRGAVSGGWFYGLTERGRARAMESMPQLRTIHCTTRENYLSATERRTMIHSSHYTEYCTGLIEELRNHPLVAGLFFETESTILGDHLRMDGLVRIRMRQTPPQQVIGARPPWFVPWLPGLRDALEPGMVELTFAIEIDEGTEELPVIQRKGENYKRTYLGGMQLLDALNAPSIHPVPWQQVLCPVNTPPDPAYARLSFPITVFIVIGPQRLSNVREFWQRGWSTSEIRMTSWQHIHQHGSIVRAPYKNHHGEWVDLLGHPHAFTGDLPPLRLRR